MLHIPAIPYIYPICILASFIVSFLIIAQQNKKEYSKETLLYYLLTVFIFSMFGGMVLSLGENMIKEHRFQIGLSSYGGAVGLLTGIWFYKKVINKNIKKLSVDTVLALPLIYGLSKLACGMNGCCCGFEFKGPLSVIYGENGPYFPVQFVETAVFIFIYILIIYLNKNKKINKYIIYITMITAGTAKGLLDFLRSGYSGISLNQVISILFIFIGISFLIANKRKSRPA